MDTREVESTTASAASLRFSAVLAITEGIHILPRHLTTSPHHRSLPVNNRPELDTLTAPSNLAPVLPHRPTSPFFLKLNEASSAISLFSGDDWRYRQLWSVPPSPTGAPPPLSELTASPSVQPVTRTLLALVRRVSRGGSCQERCSRTSGWVVSSLSCEKLMRCLAVRSEVL